MAQPLSGQPWNRPPPAPTLGGKRVPVGRWIESRGRPLNVRRQNSSDPSQNDWRAGSRGWRPCCLVCY